VHFVFETSAVKVSNPLHNLADHCIAAQTMLFGQYLTFCLAKPWNKLKPASKEPYSSPISKWHKHELN